MSLLPLIYPHIEGSKICWRKTFSKAQGFLFNNISVDINVVWARFLEPGENSLIYLLSLFPDWDYLTGFTCLVGFCSVSNLYWCILLYTVFFNNAFFLFFFLLQFSATLNISLWLKCLFNLFILTKFTTVPNFVSLVSSLLFWYKK